MICPTCGRNRQKITEDEIVSVLNLQNWMFEYIRSKNIAEAITTAGFAFKDALETFTFKDGDIVNEVVPEICLLPGEVRRIEMAFKAAKIYGTTFSCFKQ
jgi:hypothetical protein